MSRHKLLPKPTAPKRLLLFTALLLLLSVWAAMQTDIKGWELTLFDVIYGLPTWLMPLFLGLTFLGSGGLVLAVAALYLLKKRLSFALRVLVAGSAAYVLVMLLKGLIERPRPIWLLENVESREILVGGFGFPSGHTAMATAVALTILPTLPKKYRWVVPAWIVGVGVSRIYLGVHAPLDVAGGFVAGIIIATGLELLRKLWPRKLLASRRS